MARLAKLTLMMAVIAFGIYLFFEHERAESCFVERHDTLSGYGPYAKVEDTTCGSLGGSEEIEVYIVRKSYGIEHGSLIFKYEPSSFSGPLQVKWIDRENLSIYLQRADFIETRISSIDEFKVKYVIGAVGPLGERQK